MTRITETGERIILELARFRYLSPRQLHILGVSSDITHIRDTLRRLGRYRPALTDKKEYGLEFGRLPAMHFLTKAGAEKFSFAKNLNISDLKYAKKGVDLGSDYQHRKGCIDFHIALYLWTKTGKHDIKFYHAYYDAGYRKDGRLQSPTSIYIGRDRCTPDGVFMLNSINKQNGEILTRLCIFEFSRGMDNSRVAKQLEMHCKGISLKRYHKEYNYENMPRICWVFDNEKALLSVQKKATKNELSTKYANAIFFKTVEEINANFNENWRSCNPEISARPLF